MKDACVEAANSCRRRPNEVTQSDEGSRAAVRLYFESPTVRTVGEMACFFQVKRARSIPGLRRLHTRDGQLPDCPQPSLVHTTHTLREMAMFDRV